MRRLEAIDLNGEPESCVPCSICLDLVTYGGERSRAKLQCGHEFHLDCIGSAFNIKGKMQCPNCRKIEKGRWLYATGSTNSPPEWSMEDRGMENYPLYFGFTEMPYRIHLCPFRGLTQVHQPAESNLAIMSTLTPMISHQQHPRNSHPYGWVQFQQAPYHHQQPSGLPIPISSSGGFDSHRSMPRFMPPGRVYDPNPGFSLYAESLSMSYWGQR